MLIFYLVVVKVYLGRQLVFTIIKLIDFLLNLIKLFIWIKNQITHVGYLIKTFVLVETLKTLIVSSLMV